MHHLKIQLYPRMSLNKNFEYIELAQNHDQTYSWNIHDAFNHECLGQHHTALKDIEEKYKDRATKLNPNIWNEQQSISIHVQDKNNEITILDIGHITIHSPPNNINQSQIILTIVDHNGPAPHYNLSAIHTMPAKHVAQYILSHIPVDHIIQRYVHDFPHQHPYNANVLHHYHPKLSPSIPCATSQIVNKDNYALWGTAEKILNVRAPMQNDQYIRIGTCINQCMINEQDPRIDPNDSVHTIIPKLAHHIHESYMQHPDITTLSEHEKIRIHRVFHDHGHDIARQIYHDTLRHRAARLQSPVFTFPRIDL